MSATSRAQGRIPSAAPTGSTSAAATAKPSSRRRCATAAPIPLAAPVTTATAALGSMPEVNAIASESVKSSGRAHGSAPRGVTEDIISGWHGLRLTNDELSVTVLPGKGADIYR